MFFDIFFEEFRKKFKPSFREEGYKTYCMYDNQDLVYKDERTLEYVWVQEYSQDVKNFIIGEIQNLLTPKVLVADYYPKEDKVIALNGNEIKEFVVLNSTYLNILISMNLEIIPVYAVRVIGQGYKIRPKIRLKVNGFDYKYQQLLALKTMFKLIPGVISYNILDEWNIARPQATEEQLRILFNILQNAYKNSIIEIKKAYPDGKIFYVEVIINDKLSVLQIDMELQLIIE